MRLSFAIVTYNRRDTLLSTLRRLAENAQLPHDDMEVLVVDNASTDGTPEAVAKTFPRVGMIRRTANQGACARNFAMAAAKGRYIVVLDDDSYPVADAVERSMRYLDANAAVGAVTGRVVLGDGSLEASALPSVMISCAVCLRRSAVEQVGAFPLEFSRQAEEYDLSFRLWQAGHRVERFEDLVYRHEKVAGARPMADIHRLDMRNNLVVLGRYLPKALRREYRRDWVQRYLLIARHAGQEGAAIRGMAQARVAPRGDRATGRPALGERAIESIFALRQQADAVAIWSHRHGVRRVVIGDFSKNLFATWRACGLAGIEVVSVADNHPAFVGQRYRNVPIAADADTIHGRCDGVVLSTTNPARVERRANELAQRFGVPLLQLWRPQFVGGAPATPLDSASDAAA